MLNKFLAVTALTMSLSATTALAQTGSVPPADTGTATTGTGMTGTQAGAGMPSEFDGAIGDAFFSDADTGTLRSDDEIRTNWGTMSETDRISVQNYCARVGLEQVGAAGTASGIAADDAEDQRAQTEQMGGAGAAAGSAAGVTTQQAGDQQAETEQMADAGAAAGQAAGVPSDQASDQHDETEQMGDHGVHNASIARVCDMIETM